MFQPEFPVALVRSLFGDNAKLAVGLWLSVAVLGLWASRGERWLWPLACLVTAVLAITWLVLQPPFLYPRFFIFLLPASAYLIASAIRRWPLLAAAVWLGMLSAVLSQVPGYSNDPLALRQVASVIRETRASERRPCVLAVDDIVVMAYSNGFRRVARQDELAGCDVVIIASWNGDPALRSAVLQEFPIQRLLPAQYPAIVASREPADFQQPP
jgi:hypothetical protein